MSSDSSGPINGQGVVMCEANIVQPHQNMESSPENSGQKSLSSWAGRSLFGTSAPPPQASPQQIVHHPEPEESKEELPATLDPLLEVPKQSGPATEEEAEPEPKAEAVQPDSKEQQIVDQKSEEPAADKGRAIEEKETNEEEMEEETNDEERETNNEDEKETNDEERETNNEDEKETNDKERTDEKEANDEEKEEKDTANNEEEEAVEEEMEVDNEAETKEGEMAEEKEGVEEDGESKDALVMAEEEAPAPEKKRRGRKPAVKPKEETPKTESTRRSLRSAQAADTPAASRRSSGRRVTATPEETAPRRKSGRGRPSRGETPASEDGKTPRSTRKTKVDTPEPSAARGRPQRTAKEASPLPVKSGAGRKAGSGKRGRKSAALDPYDLDSNIDSSPEPLKHISMERSSFGELRFTTPQSSDRPRFSFTAKAAVKRQAQATSDSSTPHSTSYRETASEGNSKTGELFGDIEARDEEENEEKEEEQAPVQKKRRSTAATPTPKRQKQEGSATKKRAGSPLPQLSSAEQLRVDFATDSQAQMEPGARVLAKWLDKCYYPGVVMANVGFGRYKIRFVTDGNVRAMPGPDLVPLSKLTVGKTLMVTSEDDNGDESLEPIEILKTPNSSEAEAWTEALFEVLNTVTEKDERVPWEKFVIDKDQRSGFVDNVVNKAAQDVVSDNISAGKARRSRPSNFSPQEEMTPPPQKKTPRQKTPRTSAGKAKSKAKSLESTPEVVPVAKKPQKIFKGYKFILTSANRRPKTDSSDNDGLEERPPVVFNKRQVRQAIEERGGSVVEDFGHTSSTQGVFLVADTHYRTHKYLSALARAVPCVSHMWILDSCAKNEAIDYAPYMLPAGISLSSRLLIEWHADAPTLLKGLKVMVHTENRNNPGSLDFVQIWAPLVKCMGADVVDQLPKEQSLDILLTDASCPASLLESARSQGADIISSEWLIQAIITGERPEASAHEKFKYDYVEQVGGGDA